jgi:hypothetical protein
MGGIRNVKETDLIEGGGAQEATHHPPAMPRWMSTG